MWELKHIARFVRLLLKQLNIKKIKHFLMNRYLHTLKKYILQLGFHFFVKMGISSYWFDILNKSLYYTKWIKNHNIIPVNKSRQEFWSQINDFIENEAIDFLEFGVFEGYSIKYWAKLNTNEKSRFFGFDTFEGLPEIWKSVTNVCGKGAFGAGGKIPTTEDKRIVFIQGLFQVTLPKFLKSYDSKNRLVIHCDADLYSATLFILASLNNFIKPETIIIFDEFASINNEFQAFCDYTLSFMRDYDVMIALEPYCNQIAIKITR